MAVANPRHSHAKISRHLFVHMAEHVPLGFVVELGLELVLVLERNRARGGRLRATSSTKRLTFGNFAQYSSPSAIGTRRAQPHTFMSTIV